MSDIALTRVDKEQEFAFIIETADLIDSNNGRLFNKLSNRDKSGDPNTIDKDDLKEALKLDDRKREYSRGFLTDAERRSVSYMLKHWDDEKLKVIRDDLTSFDSDGNEFRHQGFADISRRSVERAVSFYAHPINPVVSESAPPLPQSHEPQLREQQRRDMQLRELQQPRATRGNDQSGRREDGAKENSADCPERTAAKKSTSEAEIIKNTQAYLSGKKGETEEYKPYISQNDAVKEEMRRRQIFAMTPLESKNDYVQSGYQQFEPADQIEPVSEPAYTFRDGMYDALGVVGNLTRAAEPFLMWDVAKEHARNQNNFYRRASHLEGPYGASPYGYYRPPSPWLYNQHTPQPYFPGYGHYGPRYGNGPYYGQGNRYGGNYYAPDSDMEFSHAGPDGLTFSHSRQRAPRGGPPAPYYSREYDDYRGSEMYDTLGLLNGLTRAAIPWLQWDLAKQHARNQRELYNRYRR
ncbi:MAG: hypothetical protein K2Y39_21640 [Candidatus Obscuribacterales bacterium]|nr:hypothetical protein [Candidatus Obscuribacterales bacterium]